MEDAVMESPMPVIDGWFERFPTANLTTPTPTPQARGAPVWAGQAPNPPAQPLDPWKMHHHQQQQQPPVARKKTARLLKMDGCILKNYGAGNTDVPLWEVNLRQNPMSRVRGTLEFVVYLPRGETSFFASSEEEANLWEAAAEKAMKRDIEAHYEFGRLLGEGAFAQVYRAKSLSTGETVAVKKIEKRDDEDELAILMQEINILRSVNHPNIIRTHDIFDTPNCMHIVLEYIEGGELFDLIAGAGRFSEKNASDIMRQMFSGLKYLHMHSIVHRDIKPENVLCHSNEWPVQIKMCDFGLAEIIKKPKKDQVEGLVGTPGYVAPEVVRRQKIGPPIDMWACGVLLYIMLSGKMPFFGRDEIECLRRIARCQYSFPEAEWAKVSEEAKSLVKGLLCLEQNKRLTAESALYHPFMTNHDISDKPLENDLSGLSSSKRHLRRLVRGVITANQISEFLNEFKASGTIQ